MRIFTAEEVREALPMAKAVDAMKNAFSSLSAGKAVVPLRTHIAAPSQKGNALFMPSYMEEEGRMGVKIVTLYDDNPRKSLPRIQALMLLFDATNGSPLAMMDAESLTAIRTGAASGAATDLLARPDASTAMIFGAGVQGKTQLQAICAVRPIKKAWIADSVAEAAENYADEMSRSLGIEVIVGESPSEADIVCTATTSASPVFHDSDLKRGTHINAVGSYQPEVQEIPSKTVQRARVVVDSRDAALAETGDLIIPLKAGLIDNQHIQAELGELVTGAKEGRANPDEITLFKSVGLAVQDLAAAACVLERNDLGRNIPL